LPALSWAGTRPAGHVDVDVPTDQSGYCGGSAVELDHGVLAAGQLLEHQGLQVGAAHHSRGGGLGLLRVGLRRVTRSFRVLKGPSVLTAMAPGSRTWSARAGSPCPSR